MKTFQDGFMMSKGISGGFKRMPWDCRGLESLRGSHVVAGKYIYPIRRKDVRDKDV